MLSISSLDEHIRLFQILLLYVTACISTDTAAWLSIGYEPLLLL